MNRIIAGLILIFSSFLYAGVEQKNSSPALPVSNHLEVPVLAIDGAIGPAVSDYLIREINEINRLKQSPIIILTIDTPGGLSSSLRDINERILSSTIPLVCLVHPQGARAASAGTYIIYACHVSAMSTATTLGAATPVMISGPMPGGNQPESKPSEPTAMEKKVLNDSIAYIRSLAQLRKRNEEWAELAVSQAATLTAREALDLNVIDLMADSPEQLLVKLADPSLLINQQQQLVDLSKARLDYRKPDWRSEFIATITNPNIAYILMLVGIYGLLLEFYSPGIGVAGVTGGICLFIAMYAFQMLPLNYAGLGLLVLGIAFIIIEVMMPSFGVFGIGGIVAFIVGSIFLIDTKQPQFQIATEVIATVAATSGIFFFYVVGSLWRLRKHQVVTGHESILNSEAIVEHDFNADGFVLLGGERWAAHSSQPLSAGDIVRIQEVDGLTLIVKRPPKGK